jgi:hypothetical protein
MISAMRSSRPDAASQNTLDGLRPTEITASFAAARPTGQQQTCSTTPPRPVRFRTPPASVLPAHAPAARFRLREFRARVHAQVLQMASLHRLEIVLVPCQIGGFGACSEN